MVDANRELAPRLAGATVAAKGTLASARVVARSFAEHHPDIPFFVLLADEVDGYFDPVREPYELLLLHDLDIPDPPRFHFGLAQQPLSFAATPYLVDKLLDLGYERVLFIKQESLVLGKLDPIVAALPDGGIALTPHLLAPLEGDDAEARELNILLSGVFNVGLVGIAAGGASRRFLRWWEDCVYRHCRHAVAEGMHYEQRWLDLAPGYFEDVQIVRDPGVNVAHWNLPDRRVSLTAAGVVVDGHACRLFRFSGFDPDRPDAATVYSARLSTYSLGDAGIVFGRYRNALLDAGWEETRAWPYAYACFDNGVPIPDVARTVYQQLEDVARFGDPFAVEGRGSFFHWLREAVDDQDGPSRLWLAVYEQRPDLQEAFPAVLGKDRRAFLRWTRSSGAAEYAVSEALR
jgi:hypothetical protein